MGKGLDKFLNIMRLNDDNYDEDYDDEFSEDYNDYVEDYDDYDDEPEEPVVPKKKKTSSFSNRKPASSPAPEPARDYSSSASAGTSSRTSSSRSKIVPMKQPSSRSAGMEVSIQKPSSFEDSSEICDELLNGKAAIVNLEGIDVEVAQRIIDFCCGSSYCLNGGLQKVSGYIFILTPASVEISGDIQDLLSGAFDIPSIRTDF